MTATTPLIHDARNPSAIAAAADALARGLLVILPTETVYGLACSAASAPALMRFNQLIPQSRPSAWHAPSSSAAREALQLTAPIHNHLLSRLAPGPVTFVVERTAQQLEVIRQRLGVPAGAMDDGQSISVRIPDHSITAPILERAPVIAQSIAAAGWGDGRSIPDTFRRAAIPGIGAILDDGPTRLGRPSTAIRLLAAGGYRILSEGALSSKTIQRLAQRTILFVCTGNTCRSPMAEAIAIQELAAVPAGDSPPVPITATSAGVSAHGGDPATPETIQAIESLGLDASHLSRHRSRPLTAQMLDEADAVYAMTASHARAARAMNPAAADKVRLLDPEGSDIPDPIGGSLQVYTRTAQRLRELIRRRLAEARD